MAINYLQQAHIIKVENDRVVVAHPSIANNLRTFLTASVAAAGVTLTVKDNSGWADNQWFILGYPGDPKTEECDINQASITRGTSLTITNSLALAHDIDCPMTRVYERKVRIKGAATLTGSQTEVTGSPFTITWDKPHTECVVTTTDYNFYFAEFSDGAGSPTYGAQSDGIANASALTANSVEKIIQQALTLTGEKISADEIDGLLTRSKLLDEFNNWQDDVANRKNWSFETTNATLTASTGKNTYALSGLTYELKHPNSDKAIISAMFGHDKMNWIDWHNYIDETQGQISTTVSTAITAADTSCILTDTYEFSESGTIKVGADTVTYTANSESTGTLTGIPSSGANYFTENHSVGDFVWQGVSFGKPCEYTIYGGNLITTIPVKSTYNNYKIKLRYWKRLAKATELTDTTDIPFYNLGQYFLASRIEYLKQNLEKGDHWFQIYEAKVALEEKKDKQPSTKSFVPQVGVDGQKGTVKIYKSSESSQYNNS